MRDRVFTATEWRCRFHFTIYPREFIWQRAAGRVRYCRRLLPRVVGHYSARHDAAFDR